MTLREAVADRACWLDTIKPGWERLVPLQEGELDMGGQVVGCAPCIADHVFAQEATGVESGFVFMWKLPEYQQTLTDENIQAFYSEAAATLWREEISARLAVWTPDPEVLRDICEEEAVTA